MLISDSGVYLLQMFFNFLEDGVNFKLFQTTA